jgi:hypothetical protein
MAMGPVGPETKNDCADEGQKQITRPDLTREEHYGATNMASTQKDQPLLLSKRKPHLKKC